MSAKPRQCSIVVLGDAGVGKTALIWQYLHGVFDDAQSRPSGRDCYTHLDTIDGRQCLLKLTECGLDEGDAAERRAQIVEADAIVLVYSIHQPASLKALRHCVFEVVQCRERFFATQREESVNGATRQARRYSVPLPVFVVGTHAPAVQAELPLLHKEYSPQAMWRVAEQVALECVARVGWTASSEPSQCATMRPQPVLMQLPRNVSATYPHLVVSAEESAAVTLLFRAVLRLHAEACRQRTRPTAAATTVLAPLRRSGEVMEQISEAARRQGSVHDTRRTTSNARVPLTLPPMGSLYATSHAAASHYAVQRGVAMNAQSMLPRPRTSLLLPPSRLPPASSHLQYTRLHTAPSSGLVASSLARRSASAVRGVSGQTRQLVCVPQSRLYMARHPSATRMPRMDEAAVRPTFASRRSGSLSDLPPPRTSYRRIADDAAAMSAVVQNGQKHPQKVHHARCFG